MQLQLTNNELKILDSEIDSCVRSFELLSVSRPAALKTVLHAFDVFIKRFADEAHLAQRGLNYSGTYNALDHAVRWIYKFCEEESQIGLIDTNLCAIELMSQARNYHHIFVQMSLAFSGRHQIERVGDSEYRFCSNSREDLCLETARSILTNATNPENTEDTIPLTPEVANQIVAAIKIRGVSPGNLEYDLPESHFQLALKTLDIRRLHRWTMDGDWDLGGYTFTELRTLWNVMKTQQAIDDLALSKLARQQDRNRYNLRIAKRSKWVTELAVKSGLPVMTVQKIFTNLIYDPILHQDSGKRGHVMFQPFFDLGDDQVVRSNSLVMISAVEKCTWMLCELLDPKRHSQLGNKKEAHWIENEFMPLQSDKLKIFPRIRFSRGDIDILFIDVQDKFGLVGQLKWTTSADKPAGVASDDRQFAEGVQQAERSLLWARENLRELSQRLDLDLTLLKDTELQPIVITKEMLPSGTFSEQAVPVINEALFKWIVTEPHHRSLRDLWYAANRRTYLPKENVHFSRYTPQPILWNGITFTFEDIAYKPLEPRWNPLTDIEFGKGVSQ